MRPILGRKACVGLQLIQVTDCDKQFYPPPAGSAVYATTCPQSKEDIMQKYSALFGEGVGLLAGD